MLRKYNFRVESKKVISKELIILKMDYKLQELMKDYRSNKMTRLNLFVKFNLLEVVLCALMLDIQPF